jgi:NTP pyrophosphatase (non-canonical NTP hydrolase)
MIQPVTPPIVHGLRDAQHSFTHYQSKAFEDRPPSFFALELAGECGELANLEKKAWRVGKVAKPTALEEEAADVFITLINYCNSRKIDLEKAVEQKLHAIEQRRQRGEMGPVRDYFGE